MTTAEGQRAYRIEDLSHLSGTTVRTIRAYTDRGLLPKPDRHGRANLYDATHLARLRQIADLLERGYTLASIKELLAARDTGTGLDGVLGGEPGGVPATAPTPSTAAAPSTPARPAPPAPAAPPAPGTVTVRLPAATVDAVRALVGADHVPAFVAAAADREVAARRMDALAEGGSGSDTREAPIRP